MFFCGSWRGGLTVWAGKFLDDAVELLLAAVIEAAGIADEIEPVPIVLGEVGFGVEVFEVVQDLVVMGGKGPEESTGEGAVFGARGLGSPAAIDALLAEVGEVVREMGTGGRFLKTVVKEMDIGSDGQVEEVVDGFVGEVEGWIEKIDVGSRVGIPVLNAVGHFLEEPAWILLGDEAVPAGPIGCRYGGGVAEDGVGDVYDVHDCCCFWCLVARVVLFSSRISL